MEVFTCASNVGCRARITVASFTGADNSESFVIVRTDCIDITATVLDQTTIYRHEEKRRQSMCCSISTKCFFTGANDI